MSSCVIQLDNYEGQYYPGNVIEGKVICIFNKSKNIRGIELELKGEEHNAWTTYERHYDHHRKKRRRKPVHYKGHNIFLHVKNTLHGQGDIGPGTFEYPFTFQLPTNLPSTYQGQYGGVSFSLEAKVDRPFKFDYEHSIQVIVASPINFNEMRGLLQLEPTAYSVDKTLCCWCCTRGSLTMEVHLEKEAFVVGEVVNVTVNATNMSNKNIESIHVKLGLEVKSMATHPRSASKKDYELLATSNDTGVGAHGQRTYNLTLEIPESAQVPNFNRCELFDQTARLEVTAVIQGCHTDMEVTTAVAMGHIPINGSLQNPDQYPSKLPPPDTVTPPYSGPIGFAIPKGADPGPSAPPSEGVASAPPKMEGENNQFTVVESDKPWSTELPPPSYNEAMFQPPKQ